MSRRPQKKKASAQGGGRPAVICTVAVVVGVALWYGGSSGGDDVTAAPVSDDQLHDRLLEWGRGLGLTFPGMIIRKGPVGRGLFVKKKAKAGKTLYEVPETMWFSIPTIRNFSAFSSFVDDADFIRHSNQALAPDKVMLAWAICHEMLTPTSRWKPYIDTLPRPTSEYPPTTLWGEAQLHELHSSAAAKAMREWITTIRETHRLGQEYFQRKANSALLGSRSGAVAAALGGVERDTWLWAYFMIHSRAFDCELPMQPDGEHTQSEFHNSLAAQTCLIPVVDLANADPGTANTNTMVLTMPARRAYYSVRAPKLLLRGAEVFQNYAGTPDALMPTLHYLMYYGFVDSNLAHARGDYVAVTVGDDGPVWAIRGDGAIPRGLIEAAGGSTSTVLAAIMVAAETALRAAPTTLEADTNQLEGGSVTGWHHATLLFRIRWKRLLHRLAAGIPESRVAVLPQLGPNDGTVLKLKHAALYALAI